MKKIVRKFLSIYDLKNDLSSMKDDVEDIKKDINLYKNTLAMEDPYMRCYVDEQYYHIEIIEKEIQNIKKKRKNLIENYILCALFFPLNLISGLEFLKIILNNFY